MPEQPRARQLPARRAQRRQQVLARLLPHSRLAAFHWERQQNLGFWKQLTLRQKGVMQEEGSGAPEPRVGAARPLLQGKRHGRAQLPSSKWCSAGILHLGKGTKGPQHLALPPIPIKGHQVSADGIWLLGAKKPLAINISS